jgi:DNA polymerase elongation subunit (family B)
MERGQLFAYSWTIADEEKEITSIRIYGLTEQNENICVVVNDFTPYVYLELPDDITWTDAKAQMVVTKIDNMMRDTKPLIKKLMFKKKLYYAKLDENKKRKLYPYLFLSFSTVEDIKQLGFKIRKPMFIPGVGNLTLKIHEHNANPILQLTSIRDLPTAGWINFIGKKVEEENRKTRCEYEYSARWKNLAPKGSDSVARPLLMGYDIEVNSSIPSSMPKAERPADKIFQVSCVFGRQGAKLETYEKYLLSLGDVDPEGLDGDNTVLLYETEHDLLLGFVELIQEKQPNIIIGYNIFTFDIPYMIDRAKAEYCMNEFDRQGLDLYGHAKEKTIEWSSSAYKNQSFQFLDAEGRIFVDLLPLVRRDYKMSNYQLKTIASHFLKDMTKDPLDAKGIFKCYRLGMQGGEKGRKAMTLVGKYCIKDSLLVVRLFEVLTTWVALCEMSKVTNVPIFALYTQGQQLKVFSQVYKKCTHENIVVEKDGYLTKENDHYVGATVFPPVAGVYDRVLPFDFSSLYPTTIIAYNICWSTLVEDEKIPDEDCHVMKWSDHIGCEHDPKEKRKKELTEIIKVREAELKELRKERDLKKNKERKQEIVDTIDRLAEEIKPFREERSQLQKSKGKHIICCDRQYRWLKKPMGVLPEILTHLLDTRASTKKEMKGVKAKLRDISEEDEKHKEVETYYEVLDQRQLALKISSNSCYGALGVRRGYLPFMPGAMCTTYMGRMSIEKAAKSIQEDHGGVLVYGDSVSGDTPVLVRYPNETINIHTIDDLGKNWVDYEEFKGVDSNRTEKEQAFVEGEVWTNGKWSKIVKVIRHKTHKKMYRILTHTGCVDVTEDHSLLDEGGNKVKPTEVKIGDRLLHSFPTDFQDFDIQAIEGMGASTEVHISTLTYEEAYIWGAFMSYGFCDKDANWQIIHNLPFLDKVKTYISSVEPECDFIIQKHGSQHALIPLKNVECISRKYHQILYKEKEKIVPYQVLNASRDVSMGFYLGSSDSGLTSCTGKIGAQGIYFLYQKLKMPNITVHLFNNLYAICTWFNPISTSSTKIKKIIPLPDSEDYVYDIETEEGIFQAGVGELVLKNTDSNYISFPHLTTAPECWDYATQVASAVSKLFPKPMSLAFEEKIYWRFFIITKKRYMSLACERDGVLDTKISKKGVLLQRRDNCSFVRKVYGDVVMKIFNRENRDDILYYILEELNKLCSRSYPYTDFIVTKSVGDFGDDGDDDYMVPVPGVNAKGVECWKVGDYTVKKLPDDEKEKDKQFKLKNCDTEKEYYLHSLPAQAQLAQKMRERGQLVSAGSRIEYVITTNGGHNAKQYLKVEDAQYFARHATTLQIDYMYYLKQLSNPLDQVLDIIYEKNDGSEYKYKPGFVLAQYKYRLARVKLLDEIRTFGMPILCFE